MIPGSAGALLQAGTSIEYDGVEFFFDGTAVLDEERRPLGVGRDGIRAFEEPAQGAQPGVGGASAQIG